MDRKLPELKAEAKRLGLKRYNRLRKAELINLIAQNSSPILDEEIPEINSEILKPTKYVKPRIDEAKAKKRKREIRKLEEMLGLKRPPEIKVWTPKEENLHRKIKEIGRIRLRISETASALRGFARQFRIEGIPRHGPREFMQIARREVLNLMRENRQTRARIILNCEMKLLKILKQQMNRKSTMFAFKRLKKEFRILIREDPIGDLKEFFRLISNSQISSRFVDPLSSRFQKKSQPRKRLST